MRLSAPSTMNPPAADEARVNADAAASSSQSLQRPEPVARSSTTSLNEELEEHPLPDEDKAKIVEK